MYYKYSVLTQTGNEINGIEEGPLAKIKESLKEKNYYILSLEVDIFKSIRVILEKRKKRQKPWQYSLKTWRIC